MTTAKLIKEIRDDYSMYKGLKTADRILLLCDRCENYMKIAEPLINRKKGK